MSKILYEKFHKDDEYKFSEREFQTRITVSLFCIVACMVAMVSSAYAWFVVGISSNQAVITSAYYSFEIKVEDPNSVVESEDGPYVYYCGLKKEDKHYFEIKAIGTAQAGFCEVTIVEEINGENKTSTYKTDVIESGDVRKVCIQAAEGSSIEFVPVWCAADTMTTFSLRRPKVFYIDHSMTPHIEYLVVEGVTLEDLAEYYGVSVEEICIYNGITELEIGEVIKIPGIEDDSIEPYQPPQVNVATPSNATPSNATQPTEEVLPTESTSAEESSAAMESTPATESSVAVESMTAAESSTIEEDMSASESGATVESTPTEESSAVPEGTSAVESGATTENTSATESEVLAETTSAEPNESVIFTAPDPTSESELASSPDGADQSIAPEMSTEDIEGMSEAEASEPGTESGTSPEPSL